ncbi:M12 family metallo-peptidase [Phaeodactylibacter xiamenensis]|uniref:M12 family metallo-peptidase n=1 Tax=Phaeodactylibacter xiamenensis TaxID=1524460 RepID=UPI003BA8D2AF
MHRISLTLCWALLSALLSYTSVVAQNHNHPIADEVARREASFAVVPEIPLLLPQVPGGPWAARVKEQVEEAAYFSLHRKNLHQVRRDEPQELKLRLEDHNGQPLLLELYQAEYLSPDFKLRKASDPNRAVPFDPGLHYRGIVNGEPHSLAMLLILPDEILGVIEFRGQQYNLGQVENAAGIHILYPSEALAEPPLKGCYAEELPGYRPGGGEPGGTRSPNPNNCVKMYVEVDKDIHDGKGGVTQAANYVSGVFSQVSTLYADESINLVVNEIFVWDTTDPYTGPTTLDYLVQFRQHLNGDYNGADLAHLVGYEGGGGIAYLDVICSSTFGVAYSDIHSSYSTVPTYSWTVNVVTHEIGHNLGSPHTHDCAWNGDNTPIDNCGPAAGYTPSGCYDNGQTPDEGTIMSYCHLLGSVGVSFTENFGPQPGDLIRSEVYNASCLDPCSAVSTTDAGIASVEMPKGVVCGNSVSPVVSLYNYGSETLTSVSINYSLDGNPAQNYNWTGSLSSNQAAEVTLPAVNFSNGSHTFTVSTSSPNGGADDEPANNEATSSFSTGDNTLTLSITLDGYPAETTWTVTDNSNNVLASGGSYSGQQNTTVNEQICLTDGCFSFNIFDSYGDGICCGHGNGSYVLTDNATNTVLASGGSFDSQETTAFCLPATPPCTAPTNLQATNLTANTALLSWSPVSGANQYELQYLQQGMPMNSVVTLYISGNSEQLTALASSTTYLWRVKALCSNEDSPYSSVENFSTTDDACPDSDNDGVCDSDDQCPGMDDSLIGTPCDDGDDCTENDVYGADCNCAGTLIDANNNDICDLDEVDDCVAPTNLQVTNLTANTALLSWSPVSGANEYQLQYLEQGMPMNSVVTLFISGNSEQLTTLSASTTYLWRVKALCSSEDSPYSSVENFTTTDDACPDSDNDGVCDGDDQCPGMDDDLIGTPCDDGDNCTENDVIGADCNCAGTLIDANNNDICDLDEGCSDPTGLNAFANSATSATFEWDPVPNANAYRLQYRPIGFSPTSIDIPAVTYTDDNLPAGSTVQWRVKALCSNENSGFTNGSSVTLAGSLPMGAPGAEIFDTDIQFSLFPNPARDQVTVSLNHPTVASTVVVRNMMGQTLGTYMMRDAGQLTLNTNEWGNNQVLLVTIYSEGQQPVSQRLVISR